MGARPVRGATSARELGELAGVFLRLGATAFGGPAAHIAMMRGEFVDRRGWLTDAEFLDLVGASNLIPGPSSTEVAIHIGARRAGGAGLALAGLCFLLPAALIVTAIAYLYVRFGNLPQAAAILYGVKPVVIAVVGQAVLSLGKAAVKDRVLAAAAVVALVLAFAGAPPIALIFGVGAMVSVYGWWNREPSRSVRPLVKLGAVGAVLIATPAVLSIINVPAGGRPGPGLLFVMFLKIGSVIYGSGYVLLAFLRADLVARTHWLTSSQLLDAVAVGQFTPGPVFTTATFIGYLIAGVPGAAAATFGIFLPAFVLVSVSRPLVDRMRQSPTVSAFLDGVNVASLGLMAEVTIELGRSSLIDIPTAAIAGLSLLALLRTRVNAAWLVLAGAAAGLLLPR
ncbi:MAG: chromate efflux transporter [Capsulimonadaceae bacterium]